MHYLGQVPHAYTAYEYSTVKPRTLRMLGINWEGLCEYETSNADNYSVRAQLSTAAVFVFHVSQARNVTHPKPLR